MRDHAKELLAKGALALSPEKAREAGLFDFAAAAHAPVSALYPLVPADCLDALDEHFDRAIAAEATAPDPREAMRDRLFDVAMRRFEAMEPHRAVLLALEEAFGRDPVAQAARLARTVRSARWMLALAGASGEGLTAAARVNGFALLLARVRDAWRHDSGGDFVKTMAALDKGLREGEDWEARLGLARPPAPAAE
jgi:hypothetical protein